MTNSWNKYIENYINNDIEITALPKINILIHIIIKYLII